MIEYSSDGCPNDCGYCRKHDYPCIYSEESESPLKVKPYTCCKCGKELSSDECYEYKNYKACEDCFDDVIKEVEELINKANENIEARQLVKGYGNPLNKSLDEHLQKNFKGQLEIQAKESIYEKCLREGKLL